MLLGRSVCSLRKYDGRVCNDSYGEREYIEERDWLERASTLKTGTTSRTAGNSRRQILQCRLKLIRHLLVNERDKVD